jgi:hypothetical protein
MYSIIRFNMGPGRGDLAAGRNPPGSRHLPFEPVIRLFSSGNRYTSYPVARALPGCLHVPCKPHDLPWAGWHGPRSRQISVECRGSRVLAAGAPASMVTCPGGGSCLQGEEQGLLFPTGNSACGRQVSVFCLAPAGSGHSPGSSLASNRDMAISGIFGRITGNFPGSIR